MNYKHIIFKVDGTIIDESNILFDGIKSTLIELKRKSVKIVAIISEYKTSKEISEYFDHVICLDISTSHNLSSSKFSKYLNQAGISKKEALYVGNTANDMKYAMEAQVDCALAIWGYNVAKNVKATYYLNNPYEIINLLDQNYISLKEKPWLSLAMELQFMAQAGLTYSKDKFDLERFERIREISAEMLCLKTGEALEHVKELFCNETGFQTPKLDTRAAIFQDDKILLVKENNGLWSLPGGWVDVNQSIKSNTIKEVKEEAGVDVIPIKLIALQDRNLHNAPVYAYGICKAFVLCELISGEFGKNNETIASGYFSLEELPKLAEAKNTEAQIRMCFEAYKAENWQVLFD
ncbi:NUDIX hydrolase [Inconstantimicrobium mannanitabidum]|uniref:Uncharacterized protein n=1 Tax=Inconstantimicrobium mannanitabidum TaxID=1604901 RepID=A0ACB5RBN0_9CLOT|nr:NUDIX hydrolase N-terminal domain-containing protein [Clostridium sp. TW13]GKX66486.1 hypothetical protein rsdtw13_17440 [Clostridium sp. TW13]